MVMPLPCLHWDVDRWMLLHVLQLGRMLTFHFSETDASCTYKAVKQVHGPVPVSTFDCPRVTSSSVLCDVHAGTDGSCRSE